MSLGGAAEFVKGKEKQLHASYFRSYFFRSPVVEAFTKFPILLECFVSSAIQWNRFINKDRQQLTMDIGTSILATNLLSEISFSTSRSSGPGGQNVNKVNTKASLRWNVAESAILLPDQKALLLKKWAKRLTVDGSLLIVSQEKRSQLQNKEDALSKLNQLLKEAFAKKKTRKKTKPSKVAVQKRLNQKKINSDKKKGRRAIE